MRKIIPKHKEGRKKKRNQIIIGFVLIFVMFFSTIGYAFLNFLSSDENNTQNINANLINYNGFEFSEQNGFWFLNKEEKSFIFKNNPEDVPKISSNISLLNNYKNKILYIQSEDLLAESEIKVNLRQFTQNIENACLDNCLHEETMKTCNDNFIIIRKGNQAITQDKNCLFIEGNEEELVALTDEFLFKLIGIEK